MREVRVIRQKGPFDKALVNAVVALFFESGAKFEGLF